MPLAPIDVSPDVFDAASVAFGRDLAGALTAASMRLTSRLDAVGSMAGTDPAGRRWAGAYDSAAEVTAGVLVDVINASLRLGTLLEQTGFNHGLAESSSDPTRSLPTPADTSTYVAEGLSTPTFPSAAGGSLPVPDGWSMVEHAVGYVWPNGHQDRLREAADAWSGAAAAIEDAAYYVDIAVRAVSSQLSPEVDDATTMCAAMRGHLRTAADGCRDMAGACADYAGHIDDAHSRIENELASLLAWSAGIQVSGGVLAFFTGGATEVAAQLAQGARIAAAVNAIRSAIETLLALAETAAAAINTRVLQVATSSELLRPLLGLRVSAATYRVAETLPTVSAVTKTEATAVESLEAAAARADLRPALRIAKRQLGRKVGKHAEDFGLNPADPTSRALIERRIESICDQPDEVRRGAWHPLSGGGPDYWFYRQGADVVVTTERGDFVTILKGGIANGWFKEATVK